MKKKMMMDALYIILPRTPSNRSIKEASGLDVTKAKNAGSPSYQPSVRAAAPAFYQGRGSGGKKPVDDKAGPRRGRRRFVRFFPSAGHQVKSGEWTARPMAFGEADGLLDLHQCRSR